MPKPEMLKSSEKLSTGKFEPQPWDCDLSLSEAERICAQRKALLDKLRPAMSLSYYNRLNEKLEREKRQFRALLNIDDARKQRLAQYSFVLNPSFFEQKLWPGSRTLS